MTTTLPTVDFGHVEPVLVHWDDIDAMGIVHNARYAVLLERALTAYWGARGHLFEGGQPTTTDVVHAVREFLITYHLPIKSTGEVLVHFWAERFGSTSGIYGFRFLSTDGQTVHAEGRRTIIKLDPVTQRPAPWTADALAIAAGLTRPS